MTDMVYEKRSFLLYAKEIGISLGIVACIVICDRTWENLYFWYLYDTGRLIFDAITSFHLRGWSILKYLIPAFFAFFAIKNRKTFRFGALLPILTVYACFFVITLFRTPDSLWRFWNSFQAPIIAMLFVTLNLQHEKDAKRFFRVTAVMYSLAILANAAFGAFPSLYDVFFSSVGWYGENFLANSDNVIAPLLTIGMLFCLLDARFSGRKRILIVYVILFAINELLCWSATAMVAGAILLLYFLPPIRKAFEKMSFNLLTFFCLFCAFILVVLFDKIARLEPVRFLVEDLLHKDLTLTGRTLFWPALVSICMVHPLFGHGLGETPSFYFDSVFNHSTVHAHNSYLQVWYEGGLFTLASLFALFFHVSAVLRKMKDRRMSGIFKAVLFSLLIWVEADQLAWFYLFPIFYVIQISTLCAEIGDAEYEAVQQY